MERMDIYSRSEYLKVVREKEVLIALDSLISVLRNLGFRELAVPVITVEPSI